MRQEGRERGKRRREREEGRERGRKAGRERGDDGDKIYMMTSKNRVLKKKSGNLSSINDGDEMEQNVNNCLNINIYSYLETSFGQSSNLYLNVIHLFSCTGV